MGAGVQLAGHMLKAAASTAAAGAISNPISLLVSGVGNLAPALILALGAFVIVAAYVIIALHFVMAMVEAYVVVGAGYIFLGFGGSRWTVPYTEKYMGMVVSAGVRIMVLELMIGLGKTLYTQWVATADAIATTPDILDGGTVASGWTGVQSEFGLIASIAIYALLCWTIPQIAANVASGGLSMSGGDALSSASAGAAGFAGASFGSNSSPSNAGSAETVQQIAQAAAMRGAEIGVAAATGGSGAAAMGATEAAGAAGGLSGSEAAAAALTPEPPPLSGAEGGVDSASTQVLPPDEGPGEGGGNGAVGPSGEGTGSASEPAILGGSALAEGEAENSENVAAMGAELSAIETTRQGGADVAEAFQAGTDAKAEALQNFGKGDANSVDPGATGSGTAAGTDASNDAKAEASAVRANRVTDRDATKANEAPGIDQAQQSSEDSIRNAGNAARMEALANGASPQQAIQAEREARRKARSGLSKARQVVGSLDTALNRMPDDGGRMGGITPRMGHGDE